MPVDFLSYEIIQKGPTGYFFLRYETLYDFIPYFYGAY